MAHRWVAALNPRRPSRNGEVDPGAGFSGKQQFAMAHTCGADSTHAADQFISAAGRSRRISRTDSCGAGGKLRLTDVTGRATLNPAKPHRGSIHVHA